MIHSASFTHNTSSSIVAFDSSTIINVDLAVTASKSSITLTAVSVSAYCSTISSSSTDQVALTFILAFRFEQQFIN